MFRNRNGNSIHNFFDRIADAFFAVLDFFHYIFTPVRHLFRRISHFFDELSNAIGARFRINMDISRDRSNYRSTKVAEFFFRIFDPVIGFFLWIFHFFHKEDAEDDNVGWKEHMRKVYPSGYKPGLDRFRIVLMFFLFIDLLGFPTRFGSILQIICGFVPPAFFILSGYLVLRESRNRSKRIVRAIKRSAVTFAILTVVYFALNYFYYRIQGVNIFPVFRSKRFWFNFVVLNVWQFDIGGAIWYVQALLYAYIIIYFLDKWKLLKYDWLISAVLLIFAVVTGELAGIIRWEFLGYNYIPGNFLTRALPYTLLGCFIHRRKDIFGNLHILWYYVGIIIGGVLTITEILVLNRLGLGGYYGHLIGMGIIAVSICVLAFIKSDYSTGIKPLKMSRRHINIIYYLCQPLSIVIVLLLARFGSETFTSISNFIGIITFIVSIIIARVAAGISRTYFKKKSNG